MEGKLYICPTPIGNLEDMTFRTINILKFVDLIGAEDTRRTIKLLNHFEIETPMTSYHMHNSREKGEYLIEKIHNGENIAIVSDAGMPGISDPGHDIIKLAIEEGIEVIVLPGATASITALVISGINTDNFIFEGFLPSKENDRKKVLEEIAKNKYTSIVYESPYRIKDSLKNILSIMGDINISVSRELTKKYEETIRGKVSEVLAELEEKESIKGEFVLILETKYVEEKKEIDIRKELEYLINSGEKKSYAVKKVSQDYGIPKNLVYKESLEL